MDKIWLYGIECRTFIGVLPEERRKPQKVWIDVGMDIGLAECAARDDIALTVDYCALEDAIRRMAESGERRLVEALAEQVAGLILSRAKGVRKVSVVVRKKPQAMPKTREVAVEIVRPI